MSLLETLEKIRNSPDPENEKAVEAKILTPILENLGWDTLGADLYYRYPVGDKRDRGEVDLALKIKKRTVALIEAKASREKLEDHVGQVLRYAFLEGVQICVLTNGQEWWLYLPREEGPPLERRFSAFNIKVDSVEKIAGNLEAYLSKENLGSREAEKRAKEVLKALRDKEYLQTEIPRIWKTKLDEPDEELVNLVTKWVDNEIGLRPAKEQVIALLKGLPVPAIVASREAKLVSQPSRTTDKTKVVSAPSTDAKNTSEKAVGFEFLGKYYEAKHNYQVLVGIAEALLELHGNDFENALDLSGIVINPKTSMLHRLREVGSSGYFIRLHYANFFNRSYQLIEHFGYKSSDLRIDTTTGSVDYSTLDIPGSKRTTSAKPVRIKLFDEYHKVKLWKEVIMRLADVLYRRHRSDFDRVLGLGTEKNPYGSRLSVALESAYEPGDSGIFIETSLSSNNVKRRSKKLLEEFGYKAEDLEILFD